MRSYVRIIPFVCMLACVLLIANARGATVNITVRIKNTDSVAHSYCIKNNGSDGNHDHLAAGATASTLQAMNDGDVISVRWGVDQGAGSSNCTNKDYDAMRDDNGSTTYTVVVANGNVSTPYFEMVKVTISPTGLTVSEGGTDSFTVTRTGSTSYSLVANFGTNSGQPTYSPTQDYSLKVGSTWLGNSITIPSPSSSVTVAVWVWVDGVSELGAAEVGTITLTDVTYRAPNTLTLTIPANGT